jgi:hypothetical protein
VIPLTSNAKVHTWSQKYWGVLENINKNYEAIKPKINEYLLNEVIIDMSCGAYHSLVLTQNIEFYV